MLTSEHIPVVKTVKQPSMVLETEHAYYLRTFVDGKLIHTSSVSTSAHYTRSLHDRRRKLRQHGVSF